MSLISCRPIRHKRPWLHALAGLIAVLIPAAAQAKTLMYSYDSMTPITRRMTENGLTFVFDKSFMNTRVRKIIETQNVGEAELKRVSDHEVGGSLDALLGDGARGREPYEITPQANGVALVRALCPGADRGFLVIGMLRPGRDLTVYAVGRAAGRSPWLCVTLDYAFHGEWTLPQAALPQPDRTDRFNDAPANHPY